MITENLSTLKIHKLTQAQYDRESEAGNLDETALYLTPEEEIYATTELVKGQIDEHNVNASAHNDIRIKITDLNTKVGDTSVPEQITIAMAEYAVESQEYSGCYYRVVDGETEWLNPPMVLETEYCTTERYNGNPVYVQRAIFDSLSAESGTENNITIYTTSKDIIPANAKIIELTGTIQNDTSKCSFSMPFTIGGQCKAWLRVNGMWHTSYPDEYPNYSLDVLTTEVLDGYKVDCKVKYTKQ